MNLYDFKNSVEQTIVNRGYNYYLQGNVVEVYMQEDGVYVFDVEGRALYEVTVRLGDQGKILHSYCDCPYTFGLTCKHEVAAYFELLEIVHQGGQKQLPKKPQLTELLHDLSKDELVQIITETADQDAVLKNKLLVKYTKVHSGQELEQCRRMMESVVRAYKGRGGFIEYGDVDSFTSELYDLLDRVNETDDVLVALDIAFLLLEESMEAFEYADDSDGDIGWLVDEAIAAIRNAVTDDNSGEAVRIQMFEKLMRQSNSTVFDGWEEFRIELLGICVQFANIEELRKKLITKIEQLLEQNSKDHYKKYGSEQLLQLLLSIIEQYGTEAEAGQFIRQHLAFSSFRERLIHRYRSVKNYEKVIELALEGEKQDAGSAGLLHKWKEIRYEACKELSRNEEQVALAKELLQHGQFDYYYELKQLYKGTESQLYRSLKQELKQGRSWQARSMYMKLIEEENDLPEIMEFVRESPENIERYAERLRASFAEEIVTIYKQYIRTSASSSATRKGYQSVCGILKRYGNVAGSEQQQSMLKELIAMYRHRPAFIDELSKIG